MERSPSRGQEDVLEDLGLRTHAVENALAEIIDALRTPDVTFNQEPTGVELPDAACFSATLRRRDGGTDRTAALLARESLVVGRRPVQPRRRVGYAIDRRIRVVDPARAATAVERPGSTWRRASRSIRDPLRHRDRPEPAPHRAQRRSGGGCAVRVFGARRDSGIGAGSAVLVPVHVWRRSEQDR
jgi:hypothetical protein